MSDHANTPPAPSPGPAGDGGHLERPHVRRIQPVGVQKDGQQFVALRDPLQLTPRTMVVPPNVMGALQLFQGQLSVDEIATRVGAPAEQVRALAGSLDELGLLWGPTAERLEQERLETLRREGVLPARASSSLGRDEAEARTRMEAWLDETEDPELEFVPAGIVAPHLDYERGWRNYAAAYHPLCRGTGPKPERPDRVIVLGTNHFGAGDGAVLSEFGLRSPLGDLPVDRAVVDALVARTGRALVAEQLDHLAEFSIDLHGPWLRLAFGEVPVVAALVPDPLQPMIADDGERLDHAAFTKVLREVLDELGGRTFVVASADLSHVGPQFGEPRPVDDRRADEVDERDREMLAKYQAGDVDDFLEAMRWHRNSTRWCSIGNMTAALGLLRPEVVELIDYHHARDDAGRVLVSSAALAFG